MGWFEDLSEAACLVDMAVTGACACLCLCQGLPVFGC